MLEKEIRALGFGGGGQEIFSPLRRAVARAGARRPRRGRRRLRRAARARSFAIEPMARPPVLCAGCPHTATFLALRGLDARVAGDIGCYTLAAVEPLRSIDTTVCMGASIGNAIGMAAAGETKPVVATIGDSTFLHAGMPPLIDAVYNQANITVVILDNSITAMTGGQDHPGTGRTLRGDDDPQGRLRGDVPRRRRRLGRARRPLPGRPRCTDAARGDRPTRAFRWSSPSGPACSIRSRSRARRWRSRFRLRRLPVVHEPRLPGDRCGATRPTRAATR